MAADAPAGAIHGAMLSVMRAVRAIGKDRYNEGQRFKFRGIDDIMNALHGPMADAGVIVLPEVIDQKRERVENKNGGWNQYAILTVRFRFVCGADGSAVELTTVGEAMDSGDKATNKAMSAALKYALLQVFCIPTTDMADADADDPRAGRAGPADAVRAEFRGDYPTATAADAERIREWFRVKHGDAAQREFRGVCLRTLGRDVKTPDALTDTDGAKIIAWIEQQTAGDAGKEKGKP